MATMIQIRNVPDEIHRILKRRAAEQGTTLSDLLRAEIEALAGRPTLDELFGRIANRRRVRVRESPAEAVRAERSARS